MPSPIEDYALIGDCETAALVGRDGSIDWLCWPRFDSPACFAALLGTPDHGRWQIAPAAVPVATTRRYRGETMILETEFATDAGVVAVIDFMPIRGVQSDLVRIVEGRRGAVPMAMELVLRFGYGEAVPWVRHVENGSPGGVLRAIAGPDMVTLRCDVPVVGRDMRSVAEFTVREGERTSFVLTHSPSHLPPPDPVEPLPALAETRGFWKEWAARCTYDGEWRDAVMRSLLTLKALTYRPTGGLVAAPTTSLPEHLGGERNWDYRYCWLRDATLTLLSLMDGGYFEEAQAWRDWLIRAAAGSPSQLQIMYGLGGERQLREWEVTWLPGYEDSRPVRVGNAAFGQLQIDVYGEVLDALYQGRRGGMEASDDAWALTCALLAHLETICHQPDEGIWEVRGEPQHFTHSKVMAWVAFDRGVRAVEEFGRTGPVDRWRRVRHQLREEICERAFDRELGSFVQAYDSRHLDASVLLIPLVGFLPADDPRVLGTVRAIEERLMVDGLVLRYDSRVTDDGLPPGEGAFLACSFWLADNYALQGRHDDARRLFERLLALRNDVGLLSEEYDPRLRRQTGNFPQAFSHIGLVDTALAISRSVPASRSPVAQRASGASDAAEE